MARTRARAYNAAMLVRDIGEFELIALLEERIRGRNRVQIRELRGLGVGWSLGLGMTRRCGGRDFPPCYSLDH